MKLKPTRHVWLVVDRHGVVHDWFAYRTKRAATANAKRLAQHWKDEAPHRAQKFEAKG